MAANQLILKNLFDALHHEMAIDKTDWSFVTHYAGKWKLSVADALLDLFYVDESTLARALARSHNLAYLPGSELTYDFAGIGLDSFDDLMSVGAAPLTGHRLAICNPYDDHHGYLDGTLCEREMVVTERSAILDALRKYGLAEWAEDTNYDFS